MSPDAVAPARLTDPASSGWFEQEEASRAKSVMHVLFLVASVKDLRLNL